MELAIPLIALSGFYIISNQNNPPQKAGKERFTNMNAKDSGKQLPNVNLEPKNYPVVNNTDVIDTVQQYPNPNVATDKYFNQTFYENKTISGASVGQNIPQIYSLSGDYVDSKQFKHNNMVPFNGGKVKGQVYGTNTSQSVLDNMVGTGSQVIRKVEQAPLFKPQADMQWAYGAPNMSDFYQSRVVPGTKTNNVKPFESINVGPGLDRGYGTDGSNGFNSGMEARDKWLPKTVDELRIANNPKQEYSLENLQGPALSTMTCPEASLLGKVEKNRPDRFFINTQDRWFTTVGLEKGNRLVAEEVLQDQNRSETSNYYAGSASSALKSAGYVPAAGEKPKRAELKVQDIPHCSAVGCGTHIDLDNVHKSHTNYRNNRSHNKQQDAVGSGFSRAIGAVIAPLADMFKPNKREEYVSSIRVYGNAASSVPGSGNYVINPYDMPSTTVKETTLFTPNSYIGNQSTKPGGYTVAEEQPIYNQRDTTNTDALNGIGGQATSYGDMDYAGNYRQHNNEYKEKLIVNHPNIGGTQIFNHKVNLNISKLESDRNSIGFGAPLSVIPAGPMKENFGKMQGKQQYEEQSGNSRLDGSLLSAFISNPYTHSLTNSV